LVFVVRDVGGEGYAFDLRKGFKRKRKSERKKECKVDERGDRMQQWERNAKFSINFSIRLLLMIWWTGEETDVRTLRFLHRSHVVFFCDEIIIDDDGSLEEEEEEAGSPSILGLESAIREKSIVLFASQATRVRGVLLCPSGWWWWRWMRIWGYGRPSRSVTYQSLSVLDVLSLFGAAS
jgi:hypothetical protein